MRDWSHRRPEAGCWRRLVEVAWLRLALLSTLSPSPFGANQTTDTTATTTCLDCVSTTPTLTTTLVDCDTHSSPCACADDLRCGWQTNAAGSGKCFAVPAAADPNSRVGCELCTHQSFCPSMACAQVVEPCTCAEAPNCHWNSVAQGCQLQDPTKPGGTSCADCSTQAFCTKTGPVVVTYDPATGGEIESDSFLVAITFDVSLKWCETNRNFASLWCKDSVQHVQIPYERITISARVLQIDASEAIKSFTRTPGRICGIDFYSGALCDLQDWTPFAGTLPGSYWLRLKDTAPPVIVAYSPSLGNGQIAMDGVVVLTFSEPIVLGSPSLSIILSQIDEYGSSTSLSTTRTQQIAVKAPDVSVSGMKLTINLAGRMSGGALYTIYLPIACVKDMAGNAFVGLPLQEYVFRAVRSAITANTSSGPSPDVVAFIMIAISLVICVLCVGFAARMLYIRSAKGKPDTQQTEVIKPKSVSVPTVQVEEQTTSPFTASEAMLGTEKPGFAPMNFASPAQGAWAYPQPKAASKNRVQPTVDDDLESSLRSSGSTASQRPSPPTQQEQVGYRHANKPPGAAGVAGSVAPKSAANAAPTIGKFGKTDPAAARQAGVRANSWIPTGGGTANSGGPSPGSSDGHRASTSKQTAPEKTPSAQEQLPPEVRAVHKQMQDAMEKPIAERKKMLKDLMLEYHPDKNRDPNAKEVFQHINNARGWFLVEV